jgi:hypothetical protein
MIQVNIVEIVIATTPTSTLEKFFVQPVMGKARILLLTRFGAVKATIKLAKNAIAYAKH